MAKRIWYCLIRYEFNFKFSYKNYISKYERSNFLHTKEKHGDYKEHKELLWSEEQITQSVEWSSQASYLVSKNKIKSKTK